MIKPFNEFLDYDLTSYDEKFLSFSERLFVEMGISGNLLEAKKGFLITLLINLKQNYRTNTSLNVPLRKQYYAKIPDKYRTYKHSFEVTKQIVIGLKDYGYIKLVKGDKTTKITTGCIATTKLSRLLQTFPNNIITREKPKTFVVLRKCIGVIKSGRRKNKIYEDIDYNDPEALRWDKEIKEYASLREKCSLSLIGVPKIIFELCKKELYSRSLDDLDTIQPNPSGTYNINLIKSFPVRIFNDDFRHGGRFYRGTETELQQRVRRNDETIKVKLRKYLHINGSPTIEFDYNAQHPRMLYHMKGIDYRDDPYTIGRNCDENMRSIYKKVGMICINSENRAAAIDGIQEELQSANLTQFLPDNTDKTRNMLIDKFARHNKPIEQYFFTGIGHELQRIDSDIAHAILLHFAREGILVLSIHDSFIIDSKYRKELKRAMQEFYFQDVGFQPKIK